MGNYEQLKEAIKAVIKTNGKQEITGQVMQDALLAITSSFGQGALFAGIATPETNPLTPDQNVFYLASQSGVYPNFNGLSIADGEIVVFSLSNGQWAKQILSLGGGGSVTIVNEPDEEDLTTVPQTAEKNVIRFKNRIYDETNASGKGYKILRKYWKEVNGVRKNILTQDMINDANTIYEIRYDFDLNGAEIQIKEGCVLNFVGGSLNNGTISGNNSIINAIPENIFHGITLNGTFNNNESHTIWFAKDDANSSDSQLAFAVNILSRGGVLYVEKDTYKIKSRWEIKDKSDITIINNGIFSPIENKKPLIGTISIRNVNNSKFINFEINGNSDNIPASTDFGTQSLINIENSSNIIIENLTIYNSVESGVGGKNLSNIVFTNVTLRNIGEHGFYIGGDIPSNNIKFKNIHATNIGVSTINNNRECGVIKFRSFQKGIKHKNIHVDGFYYEESNTILETAKFTTFCILLDIESFSVSNGYIKNINQLNDNKICIIHTNAISNGVIKNINAECKEYILYSFKYGDNDNTNIESENVLKNNIVFSDSILNGATTFFSIAKFINCTLNVLFYISDSYLDRIIDEALIQGCTINLKNNSFYVYKCNHLIINGCTINSSSTNVIINKKDNLKISIEDVFEINSVSSSLFVRNTAGTVFLNITRSIIASSIEDASAVILNEMEYTRTNYGRNIISTNGVYKSNECIDTLSSEVTMYGDSVTYDARFKVAKKIDKKNVIIIPYSPDALGYDYSISNNIITITLQNNTTPQKFRINII